MVPKVLQSLAHQSFVGLQLLLPLASEELLVRSFSILQDVPLDQLSSLG